MKKIIKTLLVVMVLAIVVTAFTACDIKGTISGAVGQVKCTLTGEHIMEAFAEEPATCTKDGLSAGVVCTRCGYAERNRFVIPATGHNMADATCELPSTCKTCGHTEGEALGHTPVDVEALAPTCSAAGHTAGTKCSVCKKVLTGCQEIAIDPTAHGAAVDVEALAPTCSSVGHTAGTVCEYCEGVLSGCEEIAIDPNAHYFVSFEWGDYSVYGVCGICYGAFEYGVGDFTRTVTSEFGVDQLGGYYEFVFFAVYEAGHYAISSEKTIAASVWNFETGEQIGTWGNAWLEPGFYVLGLNYFGGTGDYTINISKVACINVETVTKQPTCTEAGAMGTECTVCGHKVDGIEIPALGHNTDGTVAHKDATCTEAGVVGGTYCDRCNDGKEAAEAPIAATGHNAEGTVAHKDATCTEAGIVGGTYCTACNDGKEAAEAPIAKLEHTYVDGYCSCNAVDPNYYFTVTIPEALKKADGSKVQVSGTVVEIYQAYNSQYNNTSVYVADAEGNRILLFRVPGNWELGDKLTVKGEIDIYNTKPQVAQGSTVVSSEKHVCSAWTTATCKDLAACVVCGKETGTLSTDHDYVDGSCTICGGLDPDSSAGNVDSTPVTASKTMKELITANGWTSSTTKQSFKLDDVVSVKINGGSNTGKAYNGDHIRIYATDSPAGTITITVPEGYELVSVKISAQTGTYAFLRVDGTTSGDISNTTVSVSGTSVKINSVKNGTDGKQSRVTAIEVIYKAVGAN